MAGRAQGRAASVSLPPKLLVSFPSNHVLFCWELPPGVSHLPTSFLPPCQGIAVTRSHNALQLPSERKRCSGAVSIWHFLKKNNKKSQKLTFTMKRCMEMLTGGEARGEWGMWNSPGRQVTPLVLNFAFEDFGGALLSYTQSGTGKFVP